MSASVYPTGTTIYDPEKCWNGYTLFGGAGGVRIVDMNGNTANLWEGLAGHPVKMLPGGHVIGSSGRQAGDKLVPWDNSDLIQVDWDGNIVWEFSRYEQVETPGAEPVWTARQHHDYQREGNPVGYYVPGMDALVDRGKTLLCCHKKVTNPAMSDKPLADSTIIEVTWDGEVTWEWICSDHFEEMGFDDEARETIARNPNLMGPRFGSNYDPNLGDWVHMNTTSYLGPNKWYDAGDQRFHPDNIMWSGRQTNHVAIVDRKTGKIAWQVGPHYTATEALRKLGQIIGQHQAHMIPRGLPGEGNILVFDNGGRAGFGAPNLNAPTGVSVARRDYTRVLEFDPTTLEIVWQYTPIEAGFSIPETASRFYSFSISGIQRLPNGNTLICEGNHGRLLEVTPEHEIVWEYMTPQVAAGRIAQIYRAYRVPYEWAPQLDKPEETALPRIDNSAFRVPGSPAEKDGTATKVKTGLPLRG
jgi:hypothetical protein